MLLLFIFNGLFIIFYFLSLFLLYFSYFYVAHYILCQLSYLCIFVFKIPEIVIKWRANQEKWGYVDRNYYLNNQKWQVAYISYKLIEHKQMQSKEDSQGESEGQCFGEIRQLLTLPDTHICDVWAYNFEEQMTKLMKMTQKFNVIAMDTEFPGINVNRNDIQRSRSEQEAQYFLIRSNVEETKLIQIGLTIADQKGNVPYPICTWQFNFKFDINKEKIVSQSYQLLKKAGVQFQRLKSEGIQFLDFAQYFEASGFVYSPHVKWVVFHGSSDFAYLLRLVRNAQLPLTIQEFYRQLKKYFPSVYDLKYIIRDTPALKDVGLTKLSYQIGCNRIGPQHQAGSDSLLTLCCYFKMLEQTQIFSPHHFSSSLNVIFGIGQGYLKNNLNGYQMRDYENSFIPQDYYYPDNRQFIPMTSHMNYQMYGPTGGHGQTPLYSYLNHHTHGMGNMNNMNNMNTINNNYLMYPPSSHRY